MGKKLISYLIHIMILHLMVNMFLLIQWCVTYTNCNEMARCYFAFRALLYHENYLKKLKNQKSQFNKVNK